jgi:hypothetical protein
MEAQMGVNLKEMKEELMAMLKAKMEPVMRSLRFFKILLSLGWISTKPGQRPFK